MHEQQADPLDQTTGMPTMEQDEGRYGDWEPVIGLEVHAQPVSYTHLTLPTILLV